MKQIDCISVNIGFYLDVTGSNGAFAVKFVDKLPSEIPNISDLELQLRYLVK